jgi:hypothetical protein
MFHKAVFQDAVIAIGVALLVVGGLELMLGVWDLLELVIFEP